MLFILKIVFFLWVLSHVKPVLRAQMLSFFIHLDLVIMLVRWAVQLQSPFLGSFIMNDSVYFNITCVRLKSMYVSEEHEMHIF